ncbi:hypothetical protein AYO38_08040 [bacterium SCGC AG-212-C10]|nr:hypothetical protein AYO38_08040 [bacterium SCGC AG-212-C10]
MNAEPAGRDEIPWTARQREVLNLVMNGLTNGQIAEQLGLTLDGAKWHVSEIISRLGVDTREEAADYWRRRNGITSRIRTFPRRRFTPRIVAWLGAGAAMAVAVVAATMLLSAGTDARASGEWEQLSPPPLAPRSRVVSVWTGKELLMVGGDTYTCPPNADCLGPGGPAFKDGAALDPDRETWRLIAPAPVGMRWASTAVVGDDVYFLAAVQDDPGRSSAFLRYSISGDSWEELPLPGGRPEPYLYTLGAAGDRLIAYTGSHESEVVPDLLFDTNAGSWSELPPSPLSPGFSRSMEFANGRLFLFDHEIVPNPGSEVPSLARIARYDFATSTWEQLPTTGMLGNGPMLVENGMLVSPQLGGADGGEVNNWGREYPYGGITDSGSGAWSALPAAPAHGDDVWSAGVVGESNALYFATKGWALDLESRKWFEILALDAPGVFTERLVATAGRDAVVFGGVRWAGGAATLLGDAWIWRAPD